MQSFGTVTIVKPSCQLGSSESLVLELFHEVSDPIRHPMMHGNVLVNQLDKGFGPDKTESGKFAPGIDHPCDSVGREPREGSVHLTAMNTALAGLTTDAITGMVNTRRELSGLRLIGSEPLVKLVDEYVAMHHGMTDRVADFMEQLKNQTLTAAKLTTWLDDGHRTEALHKKVVVQMRQDLETK